MLRVARQRVVILTFDPELTRAFWLVRDYFPGIAKADEARTPPVDEIAQMLGAQVATAPCPATAWTDSSAPSGTGPMRISIPPSAQGSLHSR